MIEKTNSGSDYAKIIIDGIMEMENSFPLHERMNPTLLQYWVEEIKTRADEKYNTYIMGECEDFMFGLDEVKILFEKASYKYIDETITGLLEKDLLSMGIDNQGNIVYSLSDKGRGLSEIIFDKVKLN